jgi:hypothetical protein
MLLDSKEGPSRLCGDRCSSQPAISPTNNRIILACAEEKERLTPAYDAMKPCFTETSSIS